MNKEIILNPKKKQELAKTFKVSDVTLWSALRYKTHSKRAKTLRAAAIQRGGVIINNDGNFEPNLFYVSYHSECPHQLICDFSPRVRLVCDLESTGDAHIELDGKVEKVYTQPLMSDIVRMQAEAQEIVNELKQ